MFEKSRKQDSLLLSGAHSQPLVVMERAGFLHRIGPENVLANIDESLNRAREHLGLPPAQPPQPFIAPVSRESR